MSMFLTNFVSGDILHAEFARRYIVCPSENMPAHRLAQISVCVCVCVCVCGQLFSKRDTILRK